MKFSNATSLQPQNFRRVAFRRVFRSVFLTCCFPRSKHIMTSPETGNSTFYSSDLTSTHWVKGLQNQAEDLFYGRLFQLMIQISGFISNCVVLDVLQRVQQPSTSMLWTKYIAVWSNVHLAIRLFLQVFFLIEFYILSFSRASCKVLHYLHKSVTVIPYCHAVAMFADRALSLTHPTWHHAKDWPRYIPR